MERGCADGDGQPSQGLDLPSLTDWVRPDWTAPFGCLRSNDFPRRCGASLAQLAFRDGYELYERIARSFWP